MSFNRNQLVLLFITTAVVAALFLYGYKTSTSQGSDQTSAATTEFSIEQYLADEKKELPDSVRARVELLEKDTKSKEGLQNLIVLWDSLQNQLVSAYYLEQYAVLNPTEQNWYAAAGKYYNGAGMSNDSLQIAMAASKAKHAFAEVLKLNPNNLDAKTAMAAIIVQVDMDVMKGVGMLKEVVAQDSNNVQAIFTLGMLSIQSGQFDKAEERFKKLTTLQPFNPEYYFYLGEVYAKSGKTGEAIKTYETCKTLLKDEAAKKEIETIIQKLKNI
jgi:tetratricopeptide (TPR) repeat protein